MDVEVCIGGSYVASAPRDEMGPNGKKPTAVLTYLLDEDC